MGFCASPPRALTRTRRGTCNWKFRGLWIGPVADRTKSCISGLERHMGLGGTGRPRWERDARLGLPFSFHPAVPPLGPRPGPIARSASGCRRDPAAVRPRWPAWPPARCVACWSPPPCVAGLGWRIQGGRLTIVLSGGRRLGTLLPSTDRPNACLAWPKGQGRPGGPGRAKGPTGPSRVGASAQAYGGRG